MQEHQIIIFSILAILVLALSTYLGFLISKLRIQKQIDLLHVQEVKMLKEQREGSVIISLQLISESVLKQQCGISEGCIRIINLIELVEKLKGRNELEPFYKMYDEIKDFAFLGARENLSKQELFQQDNKRFEIEKTYESSIKGSCNSLLSLLAE